jgi:hypothetical protein
LGKQFVTKPFHCREAVPVPCHDQARFDERDVWEESMAKFITIAAGVALALGQPATAAWAQSTDATQSDTSRLHEDGRQGFFAGRTDRILIALGGLTAIILGVAFISNGHHHHDNGPRPVSP